MDSDDLVTRLLAAIEETEKDGANRSCGAVHPQLDTHHPAGHPDEAVARRCAADRKIVELHRPDDLMGAFDFGRFRNVCTTCGHAVSDGDWVGGFYPCDTLLALAEGYDLTTTEAP